MRKAAGFGNDGEKNYSRVITGLQMQTYLVIADFKRRKNKRGEEYGMTVSIMLPPESIWGYEKVTAAYLEKELKNVIQRVCCLELVPEHMTGKLVNES